MKAQIRTTVLCSFLFTILIKANIIAQYIPNGSFEGQNGFEICPPLWVACNSESTPDTGPVESTNILQTAADGESYLVLVTRGDESAFVQKFEDIQVHLYKPLYIDTSYIITFELAFSNTAYEDTPNFGTVWLNNPVILKIYGGNTYCERTELLFTSAAVNHTDWQKYTLNFTPKTNNVNYLILESDFVQLPMYFGNVLIDNLTIDDQHPLNKSFIPNVITPNGDGYNDVFFIENILRNCSLNIFDRWGNKVYENSDYDNSWSGISNNGTEIPVGNYWYVLNLPDQLSSRTGNIYIKRE